MAARISAVGLVTVSLRRSMTFTGGLHGHAGRHVWYSPWASLPRLPARSNAVPGSAARRRDSNRSRWNDPGVLPRPDAALPPTWFAGPVVGRLSSAQFHWRPSGR